MRPRIKVCGLTRLQDVLACEELGVDYLGFIFAAKSPRRVSTDFVASLPATKAAKVGVFVEGSARDINTTMQAARLDLAQLHGDQDAQCCREVGADRVIKVFWPMRYQSQSALKDALAVFTKACRFMLFDAGRAGGGHGQAFDAGLVSGLAIPKPWFLAGGLTPETVAAAAACKPYALDINSGVESAPGVKERALIQIALVNVEAS